MPKKTGFRLQVYAFVGGYDGPDGDCTINACGDKGFGVGEEGGGELALVDVFEKGEELRGC